MRPLTQLSALLLTLAHHTNAINNAFARSFALLADMGLNPDGTPITSNPSSPSFSDDFDSFSTASIDDTSSNRPPPETIVPEYVQLPVDNFYASKNQAADWHGTFYNRFWVSSRTYKPGAPVFLYDVGESDASTNALYRLQDESSFFRQLVEQYHGIGIVWEHRFYGNSSPTPVDINTPPEDFRFLNQAVCGPVPPQRSRDQLYAYARCDAVGVCWGELSRHESGVHEGQVSRHYLRGIRVLGARAGGD
jgi:hypothetical protein